MKMEASGDCIKPVLKSKYAIKLTEPRLKCRTFVVSVKETVVMFETVRLKDSLLIWIGTRQSPEFGDLSVGTHTTYQKVPLCTNIIGVNDESSRMAGRLSKKLQKMVYVSLNVQQDAVVSTLGHIERALNKLIESHSEYF